MIDSCHQLVFSINALRAFYRLDEPIQELMVEILNALICNIVSSVVQALLSMSIVGNLAALVWSLVVE